MKSPRLAVCVKHFAIDFLVGCNFLLTLQDTQPTLGKKPLGKRRLCVLVPESQRNTHLVNEESPGLLPNQAYFGGIVAIAALPFSADFSKSVDAEFEVLAQSF